MCGIAGFAHRDASHPVNPALIQAMCDRIAHRGPDDYGVVAKGALGIGMRRLSIIDLAGGHQPIANEDQSIWVVQNGEIYNYRELRADLLSKGHTLATQSDTETIAHLYEEYGPRCVERLRGMFAFALIDLKRQRLVLGRDRLGIKPLYYAELPEGLVFGSELKAVVAHPGVPRDVAPEAVAEFFRHTCVPGELSIYRAVKKLPPAHTLVYEQGRVTLDRYWQVQPAPDESKSEGQWLEELRSVLQDAVESHMVADVPIGAFLSGGLDSGALVALMAGASKEPVRTYTVGFATNEGRFDERAGAKVVAERYRTAHFECLLETNVVDLVPKIARAFDEPFADSSAIPNWLVCEETAKHVKVALSGLGGDEMFGGYERYVGLMLGERFHRWPRPLRRLTASVVNMTGSYSYLGDRARRFVEAGDLPLTDRYLAFISTFADVAEVLSPDLMASLGSYQYRYRQVMRELVVRDPLDVALYSDLNLYLPDDLLPLSDRMAMVHSLEVRVPYLDHLLVEFASRLPNRFKVRGFQKKVLFRKAIRPWLPDEHFNRPKQGFAVPMASWLKGPLKELLSDLAESAALRESPWLNGAAVRRMIEEHTSGTKNHEIRLWSLVCFDAWQRECYDHPAAVPA
ncbi:MAG: asparagine synthase (glutamine-hydrolyzing) [Gemmatimonadota bacterium]